MSPLGLTIFSGVVGACVGSFLNVVIWRLPRGQSLVTPGSRCPGCGTPIRWFDNLPILSWILLRARCRSCRTHITARYPFVEALTAALFLLLASRTDLVAFPGVAATKAAFLAAMVAVSFIDWDLRIIPDAISKPGIVVGLVAALFFPALHGASFLPDLSNRHLASLLEASAGALAGGGILLAVRWLGSIAFKKEAMGLGDVKLLAMIGAFTSPMATVYTLLLASFAGAILGGFFHVARKRALAPLPGAMRGGKSTFSLACVRGKRFDALVSGETLSVGERVDMTLTIPKDDNWFEADVPLVLAGRVVSVTPRDATHALVRVDLDEPDAATSDALATFVHARVAVPFGPFLAIAGSAMVVYGAEVAHFVTVTWPEFIRGAR